MINSGNWFGYLNERKLIVQPLLPWSPNSRTRRPWLPSPWRSSISSTNLSQTLGQLEVPPQVCVCMPWFIFSRPFDEAYINTNYNLHLHNIDNLPFGRNWDRFRSTRQITDSHLSNIDFQQWYVIAFYYIQQKLFPLYLLWVIE